MAPRINILYTERPSSFCCAMVEEARLFRHNDGGEQRLMDTSASLLDELRSPSNEHAWNQLVDLYQPLILGWLRRLGASQSDHDDLAQEVLVVVVKRIDEFQRQPHVGAFRGWLRAITTNCLRNHWKRSGRRPAAKGGSDFAAILDELEDPHSGLSRL